MSSFIRLPVSALASSKSRFAYINPDHITVISEVRSGIMEIEILGRENVITITRGDAIDKVHKWLEENERKDRRESRNSVYGKDQIRVVMPKLREKDNKV
jgi:hypothetical protein